MKPHQALMVLVLFPSLIMADARQDSETKTTPEVVAQKAVLALKENRLDDFAKAMHPEALKGFREFLVPLADAAEKDGEEEELLAIFQGVSTVEELKKLHDRQFFMAFFQGVMTKTPEMKQVMAGAEVEMLGHVMEGKDTAHVVCRMKMSFEGVKFKKMTVISLRRTEGGWAMLLSAEVEGMAELLKRQFSEE
jgi:hypothetical protein